MQHTTLSSSSFDHPAFLTKYQSIEGNESKTAADFFEFLATHTLPRDMFLHENAGPEYNHLKAKIIIQTLIPA